MKTVKDTLNNTLVIIIAISLVIFIISAFILLKVSKGITNPLNKLVFAAGKIAQGDLRDSVEINSNDEIGILYNSFDTMTKYLKDTMKTIKDSSFQVSDMSTSLSSNSKQMTTTTSDVTNSIQGVSQGTLHQASDLVDISGNILKLSDELDNIYDKINGVKDSSSLTEEKGK